MLVPCIDGLERPYVGFDSAASTGALEQVLSRVEEFVPTYSSVHRGVGYKSQLSTAAFEAAHEAVLSFAGREGRDDVAVICRNTTEAINHVAYSLGLGPNDMVVTTVIEHHANLLPWFRAAKCRYVECQADGTFTTADIETQLDRSPKPRLLAVSGASNVTGWVTPIDEIVSAAHRRGIPVLVDAAQLAPHRPLPREADFLAWSGHKMYAPYGAGVLIGPRDVFTTGGPFLAGGGAVEYVDLDEVLWKGPPDREEAGSPNVIGTVALHAAMDALTDIGWPEIITHDNIVGRMLREGLTRIPGVRILGPALASDTLPVVSFVVENVHYALVAARLSAECGIGVRSGCFCSHPYMMRLLGVTADDVARHHTEVRRGDRRRMPGAVRASAGLNTTEEDVSCLLEAIAKIASGDQPPVEYTQDVKTGEFNPDPDVAPWYANFDLRCTPSLSR
jgi:selenocysteine lyase/cysteine desulfurase